MAKIKRDPSIHCKVSDFAKLMKSLHPQIFNDVVVKELVLKLRKVSIDSRSVVISNEKLKRDITKSLQSTKGDASLLADIIYAHRIKLKHKGVKKININDREWLQVKQLAKLCNQFCEDFNLATREGFIKYIDLGLKKMQTMRGYISKLISLYETISREYESISELKGDNNSEGTLELHNIFINKIADRTGLFESFEKYPDKMLAFCKARELCDELGIDYQTFIDAQFESLEWCNGIPTPEMLTGDKAKERLNKYMYKNNITTEEVVVQNNFWSDLKNK